jgi:hypothetical protein
MYCTSIVTTDDPILPGFLCGVEQGVQLVEEDSRPGEQRHVGQGNCLLTKASTHCKRRPVLLVKC